MHTPNRKIKPFLQVTVGEEAYHHEDHELIGFIKWKGNTKELKKSQYSNLLVEDIADNSSPEEGEDDLLSDYDWVIIDEPMYGDTLYNYNCDPSGVIIMEEQDPPTKRSQPELDSYELNPNLVIAISKLISDKKASNDEIYVVYVSNRILLEDNELVSLNSYKIIDIPVAIFTQCESAYSCFEDIILRSGLNSAYIVNSENTIIKRKINVIKTHIQIKHNDQD